MFSEYTTTVPQHLISLCCFNEYILTIKDDRILNWQCEYFILGAVIKLAI